MGGVACDVNASFEKRFTCLLLHFVDAAQVHGTYSILHVRLSHTIFKCFEFALDEFPTFRVFPG